MHYFAFIRQVLQVIGHAGFAPDLERLAQSKDSLIV